MITLKNLSEATAIDVFNQVKEHLLKQGKRSASGHLCMYRGDDGLKCAAGCLVADDEYDPAMEGNNWKGALDELKKARKVYPGMSKHSKLIEKLQFIHDRRISFDWEVELNKLEIDVLAGKYD